MAGEVNMKELQSNLFDLGLDMSGSKGNEDFTDSAGERLNQLKWFSEASKSLFTDENGDNRLAQVKLELSGIRRLKKSGKFEFVLLRKWNFAGLEECIEDEIPCTKIEDLENCFNDEMYMFEHLRNLPSDVIFDGRRYFWRFEKKEDGLIEFTEKWMPEIKEVDENAILS